MTYQERAYYRREGRELLLYSGVTKQILSLGGIMCVLFAALQILRPAWMTAHTGRGWSEALSVLLFDSVYLLSALFAHARIDCLLCRYCRGTQQKQTANRLPGIPTTAVLLRAGSGLASFLAVSLFTVAGVRFSAPLPRTLLLLAGGAVTLFCIAVYLRLTPIFLLYTDLPSRSGISLCRAAWQLTKRHLHEIVRLRLSFCGILPLFLGAALTDGALRTAAIALLIPILLWVDAASAVHCTVLAGAPSPLSQSK